MNEVHLYPHLGQSQRFITALGVACLELSVPAGCVC